MRGCIARAVRRSPIATLGMKSARMTAFAQGVDLRDLRPERARALSIRIPTGARVIHEWQHPSRWSTPGPRSRHTPCQHLLEVSAEIAATPRFKTVNFKISSAWALAFAVIVAADAAMLYMPGFTPRAGTAVILTALAGAAAATAWLPKAAARSATPG